MTKAQVIAELAARGIQISQDIINKLPDSGELSDNDLEAVAAGKGRGSQQAINIGGKRGGSIAQQR